jgi:GT2 family glycosyltransferase
MRCLSGVAQLDYPSFEIVTVVCPSGQTAVAGRGDADQIKVVPFDQPNLSAARNLGIAHAAGEIIAFIDDDAVPEPLWLQHLVAPFTDPGIAFTGGYVIGRNGISFQWKARSVDLTGQAHDLVLPDMAPMSPALPATHALKTEGTNMAVRRQTLTDLGGFDQAFRFYLDETDLNVRLAQAGLRGMMVPLAQVHHGFAPSVRRKTDRTPTSLSDIAASQQVFLRKHCPKNQQADAWQGFLNAQTDRLNRLVYRRKLTSKGRADLWATLLDGQGIGANTPVGQYAQLTDIKSIFTPYPGRPNAERVILSGRPWRAASLRKQARSLVRQGKIVSLYLFSPTSLYHHVTFTNEGYWLQTGGLFGKSRRSDPVFRLVLFPHRVQKEAQRVHRARGQTR